MTRIIAGSAGGRRLRTPPGQGTRPTSDRVREALFSRLEHLDALERSAVLDLYAGSGALGLEAASRGARSVLFVESDHRAAAVLGANIAVVGAPQAQVLTQPVERVLTTPPEEPEITLALVDPPYSLPEPALADVLAQLVGWLALDAVVVIERSARSPEPTWPAGLDPLAPRRYGETAMWFAEYRPDGPAA